MSENLLNITCIRLFGIIMNDIEISDHKNPFRVRLASEKNITPLSDNTEVNEIEPNPGDLLLIWKQTTKSENGLYQAKPGAWIELYSDIGSLVISGGDGKKNKNLNFSKWEYKGGVDKIFAKIPTNKTRLLPGTRRRGGNRQLERQLTQDARFARIYGFSYEGAYYDLPRPVIFLVHGEGEFVTVKKSGDPNVSRAPREPDLTGIAAAGFDFGDELKVWSYDQADYTIRMDLDTGKFEQVLLDVILGDGPGMDVSGMNARGMNARGMNARGMNARGMNARGGNSD